MSVENNFLRFGKGLDKFVILTKMSFSSAHKVSRSYIPSFHFLEDDDDDDEISVHISCTSSIILRRLDCLDS